MTARTVSHLGIRLLAIWLAVWALTNLALLAADWEPGPIAAVMTVSLLSMTILPLAAALTLWAFTEPLGGRMVSGLQEEAHGPALDVAGLHTVGVSLLGLWLVVAVLPELVQATAIYVSMKFAHPPDLPRDEATEYRIWTYAQAGNARFASLLARFAIGGVLFLGPRRIARAAMGGFKQYFAPIRPDNG
jgi:hypothetical protein